jgi:hypothetical protein
MKDSIEMLAWVFPIGLFLTIGGVSLCSLSEIGIVESAKGPSYDTSPIFLFALLAGVPIVIVGAFLDRKRLAVADARRRGWICWATFGVSFLLLAKTANVHTCGFLLIFPAFAGFVTGVIFLWKLKVADQSV